MESFTSTIALGTALAAFLFSLSVNAQEMDNDLPGEISQNALERQLNQVNQNLAWQAFNQAHAFNEIQIMNSYGRAYVPTMSQTNF
jgi:hypothetical protein